MMTKNLVSKEHGTGMCQYVEVLGCSPRGHQGEVLEQPTSDTLGDRFG